jgi:hypothetical protein
MKFGTPSLRRPMPPLIAALCRGFVLGTFLVGAVFLLLKVLRG